MTARSKGLLGRAGALRGPRPEPAPAPDDSATSESGITEAERREITDSIVAATRRPSLAANLAAPLRASHSGLILPLVVNIAAILFVVAALYALSLAFSRQEASGEVSSLAISSAEGKLLGELQRDAESKLREKDLAIARVQEEMAALDRRRGQLAASMDERLGEKERSLAASTEAELGEEGERLRASGASEAMVASELAATKTRLEAEARAGLAAFRQELEAELAASESAIKGLKAEYEGSIAALGNERLRIQGEAKAREEELRSALDNRARELESQGASGQAALDRAKAELASINARAEAARAVEERVVGLYASIRDAIRDRRFEAAVSTSASLRAYLDDPAVVGLPALQSRLPMDRFLAETLGLLASRELDAARQDSSRLLAQAELLASARRSALAADAARRSGRMTEADALYREALSRVPELLAAHDWFTEKARAAEASRTALLESVLARAAGFWEAGDRGASLASYREALAYLPVEAAAVETLLERIAAEGAARAEEARSEASLAARAADSLAALPLDARAGAALSEGDAETAFGAWLELVLVHPGAGQVPGALKGMEAAVRALVGRASSESALAAERIAGLESKSREREEAIRELEAARRAGEEELATVKAQALEAGTASEAKVAALVAELDAMRKSTADAARVATKASPRSLRAVQSSDLAELQRQVDELESAGRRLAGMKEAYGDFAAAQAAAGDDATQGVLALRRLFADPRVGTVFAGLPSALDRTLAAYSREAAADLSGNAAFLASTAFGIAEPAARSRYLAEQKAVYEADPFMSAFIEALARTRR